MINVHFFDCRILFSKTSWTVNIKMIHNDRGVYEYFLNPLHTHSHVARGFVYWLSVVQCLAQGHLGSGSEMCFISIFLWIIIWFLIVRGIVSCDRVVTKLAWCCLLTMLHLNENDFDYTQIVLFVRVVILLGNFMEQELTCDWKLYPATGTCQ